MEAKEQLEAANTRADEALQSLRESAEREASLSDLLTTAGYSSVSLHGIDWTVGDAKKLMEEEAIRLDMLALEDEQDAATLRGSQAGTQDDGTLATGEDDMTMDDESIMSGGGGRGGPAGILDKGMAAQKSRK